jgi:hypothetical protein
MDDGKQCECTICRAKRLGCDELLLYFPEGSVEAKLVAEKPEMPIYWYEMEAKAIRNQQEVAQTPQEEAVPLPVASRSWLLLLIHAARRMLGSAYWTFRKIGTKNRKN